MTRNDIIELVLNANRFPFSVPSEQIDSDFDLIYKMLFRRGLTNRIGMTKERDKNLIWFRLRN